MGFGAWAVGDAAAVSGASCGSVIRPGRAGRLVELASRPRQAPSVMWPAGLAAGGAAVPFFPADVLAASQVSQTMNADVHRFFL